MASEAVVGMGNTPGEDEGEQIASLGTSTEVVSEWASAVDVGSGNTYYHNTVTGEVTWERPSCLDAAVEGASEEDVSEVVEETEEAGVVEGVTEGVGTLPWGDEQWGVSGAEWGDDVQAGGNASGMQGEGAVSVTGHEEQIASPGTSTEVVSEWASAVDVGSGNKQEVLGPDYGDLEGDQAHVQDNTIEHTAGIQLDGPPDGSSNTAEDTTDTAQGTSDTVQGTSDTAQGTSDTAHGISDAVSAVPNIVPAGHQETYQAGHPPFDASLESGVPHSNLKTPVPNHRIRFIHKCQSTNHNAANPDPGLNPNH